MKKILLPVVLLGVVLGFSYLFMKKEVVAPVVVPPVVLDSDVVMCTQEAMLCPDGSYVGRTGANCEFAKCPNLEKEETIAKLNQRILNNGVYVTPLQVVSDSRCPADVNCVWAGEFVLKVRLEKAGVKKEVELKEGGTILFEGSNISLVGVSPNKNSKTLISNKDYKFTFKVAS
jgi:hypothetical protein